MKSKASGSSKSVIHSGLPVIALRLEVGNDILIHAKRENLLSARSIETFPFSGRLRVQYLLDSVELLILWR